MQVTFDPYNPRDLAAVKVIIEQGLLAPAPSTYAKPPAAIEPPADESAGALTPNPDEAPKRKRRTAAEIEAAKQEAEKAPTQIVEKPAEPVAEKPVAPTVELDELFGTPVAPEPVKIDRETLRANLVALAKAKDDGKDAGQNVVKALLKKATGTDKFSEIKEDQFAAVLAAVEAAG